MLSLFYCIARGVWELWSPWNPCSVNCGNGAQIRSRSCTKGEGGVDCKGHSEQTRSCNNGNCPSKKK